MDDREIEQIIERTADRAAKRAVEAYKREQQAQESRKAYNLTFKYLKQYGNLVKSAKNAAAVAGNSENEFLQNIKNAETPTNAIIALLASSIAELEQETRHKEKYVVFEMYFFQNMTYEQITAEIAIGDSTPRRWVSEMVSILAVKLFGVEAIHK